MGDDRPIRYIEDDKVIYRASALGTCERAFIACATKTPAAPMPEWFRGVLDEGTRAEPIISGLWELQTGQPTVCQQAEFDLRIGKIGDREVFVRCHIDGAAGTSSFKNLQLTPPKTLREYKKFRDSTWPDFLRQGVECGVNYPWQVAVCMLAGDFDECEFVGGHWSIPEGETEPTITEVQHHLLTAPPVNFKAIRDRVKRIERLITAGFDAREVDCNKAMYPCPYFKVHDEDDKVTWSLPTEGEDAEVGKVLVSTFAMAASNVNRITKELEKAKAEKQKADKALREMLEHFGPEAVAADRLLSDEYQLLHVTGEVEERTAKGYSLDYYKINVRKKDKK